MTVNLKIVDHPLLRHKLTLLRDENTLSPQFRQLVSEIVLFLSYEATKSLETKPKAISTPVQETTGYELAGKRPIAVPVLRAGLGMLEGILQIFPSVEVGFLGMKRDEKTLEPYTYANRLPDNLENRRCYLLDPMLATGNTTVAAIDFLIALGAKDITSINVLASPEGIETVQEHSKTLADDVVVDLVVPCVDERLNDKGYIVPGLGDAGDRLYGIVE